jgi:CRP/FNR family cyclic AMP-dependent transcriptional regulator
MEELFSRAELFRDLDRDSLRRVLAIGRGQTLGAGQYLFILGDDASEFHVVTTGSLDLCLPIALRGNVKDISVESVGVGKTVGWSALVKPYRFTLSARATEPSEVISFARNDLQHLFESAPEIGSSILTRVSELMGIRLVTFQALWVRELQRALDGEAQRSTGEKA